MLDKLDNLRSASITPQARGRRFEKWLHEVLASADMQPRTSFRPTGEEIDGSFIYGGRIYLLEAKWHADTLPASSLYQFKGKVDGKLIGTVGVFISMSGYSEDAVEALRSGKALNLILFNEVDIRYAAELGFEEVFRFKLRAAAEEGEIFTPFKSKAATSRGDAKSLVILVEGLKDELIVAGLVRELEEHYGSLRPSQVVSTMGITGLPRVAAAISTGNHGPIVILADADGDSELKRTRLKQFISSDSTEVMIVDPGVEKWIPIDLATLRAMRPVILAEFMRQVDIDVTSLLVQDKDFFELAHRLGVRG